MDREIINNLKTLSLDMINRAGSGHSGIVMSAAPLIYTVYSRHMNINPRDPNWMNRDRFVMSAGHGSALLYATLHMAGMNISKEDLENFRRYGYKTPGHPELGVTPGVDVSTGPLGQGLATAVGLALGEKMLEARFKIGEEKPRSLFNYRVYALVGDGDLMEGVSYEAASFAANNGLNNLIVLYDSNNVTLDGNKKIAFTENVSERFRAMGWHVEFVKDGNNISEINEAINKCKQAIRPGFIQVVTTIGQDTDLAGDHKVHGHVFNVDDIKKIKAKLGVVDEPFYVSELAANAFKEAIRNRSDKKYEQWAVDYKEYVGAREDFDISELKAIFDENINLVLDQDVLNYIKYSGEKQQMRDTNHQIMQYIAERLSNFVGGGADVASSTKTFIADSKAVNYQDFTGRNINFGVREHAMGAILNGLALTGFKCFGSTFLAFSDYMKPAMRMSAMMHLPVTYIFTHDSINIGPDGPSHQPIEQLAMLRAMPNLMVFRPADAKELIGCWNKILHDYKSPAALVISRNEVATLENTSIEGTERGAYIVRKEREALHGIIIATGTEVQTSVFIAEELYAQEKLDLRVVSMPVLEEYIKQPEQYKEALLPMGIKRIVIESGTSYGWHQFVYNDKYLITLDNYGVSGTRDEVLSYCNFMYTDIKERILKLLK